MSKNKSDHKTHRNASHKTSQKTDQNPSSKAYTFVAVNNAHTAPQRWNRLVVPGFQMLLYRLDSIPGHANTYSLFVTNLVHLWAEERIVGSVVSTFLMYIGNCVCFIYPTRQFAYFSCFTLQLILLY